MKNFIYIAMAIAAPITLVNKQLWKYYTFKKLK